MWWWIGTAVGVVGLLVFWVWMHRHTDHGSRAQSFEQSDQEIADALREAQRGGDTGAFYGHR
jgi:hypothetical protein